MCSVAKKKKEVSGQRCLLLASYHHLASELSKFPYVLWFSILGLLHFCFEVISKRTQNYFCSAFLALESEPEFTPVSSKHFEHFLASATANSYTNVWFDFLIFNKLGLYEINLAGNYLAHPPKLKLASKNQINGRSYDHKIVELKIDPQNHFLILNFMSKNQHCLVHFSKLIGMWINSYKWEIFICTVLWYKNKVV